MASVGTVTFDIAAEAAKLRSELEKVKRDVGGISTTANRLERGLKTVGAAIVGAFSVGAVTSFLRNVNQVVDRLDDTSQRLGVSASRLNVFELAATQAGASTEAVSTAIAKLTENVGNAAAAADGPAAKAIQTLGLRTQQLLSLRPDQAFEAVTAALSRMPNEFQRASVAQDLFGKGARELSAFYREGETAIAAAQAALERHNAMLSDLDIARIGIMNADFDTQGKIINDLGAKFLSNLSPAIDVVIGTVSDLTAELGGADEAGKKMGVNLIRVIAALRIAANLVAVAFETVRSTVASVAAVAVTAGEKILAANLAVARALGFDDIAKRLSIEHEAISGLAESLKSIRLSAAENAQAMMTNVIQATADFMNAADLFEAKSREMDARAKAAMNRASGGSGVMQPGAGERVASRVLPASPLSTGGVGGNVRVEGPNELAFEQMTQAMYDRMAETARQAGIGRVAEWQASLAQMTGLTQLAADQQLAIEQAKAGNMSALAFGIVDSTIFASGRLGKVQKALAIASTIWNTSRAVMKAMAEVPWPGNIAAAAAIAAMGVREISKIRSTNFSSSGSVSGGGLSSGAGGLSGGSEGGFATPQAVTQQEPQRIAQVIIQGDVFSSQETVDYLIGKISEAINDRDVSFIASNSRQALDLGVG